MHRPGVSKTFIVGCVLSVSLGLPSASAGAAAEAVEPQARASVSSRLDEALRAAELDTAKSLMLEDIGAADDLFLNYLDQDIKASSGNPESEPVARAKRLADLFFNLFELDFERGIVSYWETSSLLQKQALLSVLRDHFAVIKEERTLDDSPLMPIGWEERLVAQYTSLAERYRSLPFAKGDLCVRLKIASLDAGTAEKTWEYAKSLKDTVGEAWGAYFYGIFSGGGEPEKAAQHAAEAAEKLNLPRLRQYALTRLAWRALAREDYEAHVGYFRQGLDVIKTVPIPETMTGRASRRRYPPQAWFHLVLWRAAKLNNKPGNEVEFDKGLALSREYGGRPGELAYLIEAMKQFLRPGLFKDVAIRAESLARRMGDKRWLIRTLMAKVDGLTGTQEFDTAVQAATAAAELCRKLAESGYLAECLSKRAILFAQSDRFEESARDFEESARVYDELGFDDLAFSTGMDAAYYLRSQPALAEKFYDKTLAAAEKKGDDDLASQVLYDRGRARLSRAPDEAVQDLMESLSRKERANAKAGRPGEDLGLMRQVGQALSRVGRYGEAIDIQKRRAEKARAGRLEAEEADACFWLHRIYALDLGDIGAATEYAKRYQALVDRPEPSPGINEWNKLALCFSSIGQPGRAMAYWRKALDLAEKAPGNDQFERMVHSNLLLAYLKVGDYDAARASLNKEMTLIDTTFEAFRGPIDLQKAQWFNKSALVHALAGDAGKAVEEALEAIRLESKTPAGTAPAEYFSYFTPGDALALAGRLDEAIAFYAKRKDRARDARSVHDEMDALERLGAIQARAGDLAKAREALLAALDLARKPPFPQTGEMAGVLLTWAEAELAAGSAAKGEEILAEARTVANSHDRHQLWRIERGLALASARTGRPGPALEHFVKAEQSLESAYERLRPEEFLLRFGIDRLRVYDEHALYLAELAAGSGRPQNAAKALQVVERRRHQALWDLLATGWAGLEPEAVPDQLQRVREAETSLTAKQNILRAQFERTPDKRDAALIGRLESELEQARSEHARLLASLAQGKYRYSSPGALPEDLSAPVQKRLKPRQALLEYLVGDDASYVFVITAAGLRLERLDVGRDELRRRIQGLLRPFYDLRGRGLDLTRLTFDLKGAHELYGRIFAPLERHLGGIQRILVVPDDILCYFPFEALVERISAKDLPGKVLFGEYETAAFLLNRFSVSYLAAAAHLLPSAGATGRPTGGRNLLAMADPAAGAEIKSERSEGRVDRRLRGSGLSQAFSPLPQAAVEIERIRHYFPKDTVTLLTGASATESGYKAFSGGYEVVHLATHAVAEDKQPLYSTLILAPDAEALEDGVLQAFEVLRHPLRAKLVVLSACETAFGPLGRGEGLVGLVGAFRQAGAESVLATQWSIDESAADLMAAFYKAFTGGKDMSEALREAKLRARKGRIRLGAVEISTAHPFFWAPFVLIGGTD